MAWLMCIKCVLLRLLLQAKKRRGGRRLRKMKERYGLTDVSAMLEGGLVSLLGTPA